MPVCGSVRFNAIICCLSVWVHLDCPQTALDDKHQTPKQNCMAPLLETILRHSRRFNTLNSLVLVFGLLVLSVAPINEWDVILAKETGWCMEFQNDTKNGHCYWHQYVAYTVYQALSDYDLTVINIISLSPRHLNQYMDRMLKWQFNVYS